MNQKIVEDKRYLTSRAIAFLCPKRAEHEDRGVTQKDLTRGGDCAVLCVRYFKGVIWSKGLHSTLRPNINRRRGLHVFLQFEVHE